MRKRFENNFKLICFNTCTVTLSAVILQPLRKLGNENELKKLFFGTVLSKINSQASSLNHPQHSIRKGLANAEGTNLTIRSLTSMVGEVQKLYQNELPDAKRFTFSQPA
jgi:hypothetical protein